MKRWGTVTLAVTLLAGCDDATGPKLLLDAPLFDHTAPGSWTNTTDLSVGRHFLAAAAAASDGRVFVSGGLDVDGLSLALVEAYHPDEDQWTEVASLPGDRFAHASVRGGDGLIYAIGGVTAGGATVASSVVVYDPDGDSWTSAADMAVPRLGPAAAVAGGKIYVTGGQNLVEGTSDFQVEASGEVFDPGTGEWEPIASMATPRYLHAMATGSDGRIYAIGGTDLSGFPIASVEAYDPDANEWMDVESIPSGRYGLGAATGADGHIYAYGGFAESFEFESTVITYDVGTDTWEPAPSMNEARFGFGATASPDGRIYAVAGFASGSTLSSAEFYETAPVTTITVAIDIKPGSDPNSINRKSRGNVPVAVLSSATFDATTIDRSTVEFAGAPALSIGGGAEDVNGDGLPDVVFHFATQALVLPDGTTEACLSGDTTGGTSFQGCDAVRLVK
ncbi:MAG: hypothetical protein HYV20_11760 [Gemmatimonadetes bacterium]|nr:hypothetical protein [Gemmatimonadota bacterium]